MSPDAMATAAKIAFGLLGLLLVAPIMLWVERRGMAMAQDRRGPNRVGPFGLLQGMADALKFIFKEEIIPTTADRVLYLLGPILALIPALTTFVVIPFGPDLELGDRVVQMVVVPGDVGVLLFLALASLGVYSLITAGYGSNNKYALMGSIRATAQMISYELALGFAILGTLLPVASMRLNDVVAYQQTHMWNVIPQFLGFLVFLVASYAETNRLPFDLPEAESELVAGYLTEYGSLKWAVFFMGEYGSMAALSALLATLYLGGWSLPFVVYPEGWLGVILGIFVLGLKVALLMWLYVWVRLTFPRFRYDQLMRLGWKVLLPLALLNLVLVAVATVGGWL